MTTRTAHLSTEIDSHYSELVRAIGAVKARSYHVAAIARNERDTRKVLIRT